jgi:hypothetical protein
MVKPSNVTAETWAVVIEMHKAAKRKNPVPSQGADRRIAQQLAQTTHDDLKRHSVGTDAIGYQGWPARQSLQVCSFQT